MLRMDRDGLTKILERVYTVADVCMLTFDEKLTGRICVTDTAHVCQMVVTIDRTAWIELAEVPPGAKIPLGIDRMLDFCKTVCPGVVEIAVLGECMRMFCGPYRRELKAPSSVPEPKEVNLTHKHSVVMQASRLNEAMQYLLPLTDHTQISITSELFNIGAHNLAEESGEAEVVIFRNELIDLKCHENLPVKSRFPADYVRVNGVPGEVTLLLANDYPLEMQYWLQDSVRVRYIVAPRVESE